MPLHQFYLNTKEQNVMSPNWAMEQRARDYNPPSGVERERELVELNRRIMLEDFDARCSPEWRQWWKNLEYEVEVMKTSKLATMLWTVA